MDEKKVINQLLLERHTNITEMAAKWRYCRNL